MFLFLYFFLFYVNELKTFYLLHWLRLDSNQIEFATNYRGIIKVHFKDLLIKKSVNVEKFIKISPTVIQLIYAGDLMLWSMLDHQPATSIINSYHHHSIQTAE